MALFGMLLVSAGTLLFYLTSVNQQWLALPLSRQVWRKLGYFLVVLSLGPLAMQFDWKAGIFTAVTIIMLLAGVFPLLSLLRSRKEVNDG